MNLIPTCPEIGCRTWAGACSAPVPPRQGVPPCTRFAKWASYRANTFRTKGKLLCERKRVRKSCNGKIAFFSMRIPGRGLLGPRTPNGREFLPAPGLRSGDLIKQTPSARKESSFVKGRGHGKDVTEGSPSLSFTFAVKTVKNFAFYPLNEQRQSHQYPRAT